MKAARAWGQGLGSPGTTHFSHKLHSYVVWEGKKNHACVHSRLWANVCGRQALTDERTHLLHSPPWKQERTRAGQRYVPWLDPCAASLPKLKPAGEGPQAALKWEQKSCWGAAPFSKGEGRRDVLPARPQAPPPSPPQDTSSQTLLSPNVLLTGVGAYYSGRGELVSLLLERGFCCCCFPLAPNPP